MKNLHPDVSHPHSTQAVINAGTWERSSSAEPARPGGVRSRTLASKLARRSSDVKCRKSVSMAPGTSVLTRIRRGARAVAQPRRSDERPFGGRVHARDRRPLVGGGGRRHHHCCPLAEVLRQGGELE